MTKRGQVTLFVVIGLVVLIVFGLYLYAREEYGITVPTPQYLSSQLTPIRQNIERCIDQELEPGAVLLGQQGGSFIPNRAIRYKSRNVKIACTTIPGKTTCLNTMQPLSRIEAELQAYLQFKLDTCVDRNLANKKGYTTEGTKKITTTVRAEGDATTAEVDYDLTLIKDTQRVPVPKITKVLRDAPLQDLYNVAVDIVNNEATTGQFDNLGYMLQKRGHYLIETDKPHPHKIYIISKRNSGYSYWIAIEGEA